MIILPAIDIKQGACVRLVKGDFATAHQVAEDPLQTARGFAADGAVWLHMVDLDGAVQGNRQNAAVFEQVADGCGLKMELGGGIRDMQTIEYYLTHGIRRVILGSAAFEQPDLVAEAVRCYDAHIAVGIDAKNGKVATRGWLDTSELDYIEMARRMEQLGVQTLIYTDISKDGTLRGPSIEQLTALKDAVGCNIIASGGVASLDDIRALEQAGMYGAICGKSLYAGTLRLAEAIAVGGDQYAG